MAGEQKAPDQGQPGQGQAIHVGTYPPFPPMQFPVLFTDGVWSMSRGVGVVKFYLVRVDPRLDGGEGGNPVPHAQVVMPMQGFVASALFFQQQLKLMIEKGDITQEQVDKLQAQLLGAGNAD